MNIRYKLIEQNIIGDAPFMGTRISAIDCGFNCKGCHSQWLRDLPNQEIDGEELLKVVVENPFEEGIILGGLEWTGQSFELEWLLCKALEKELKVMLYTGMTEEAFYQQFPDLYELPIWVKFGQYQEKDKTNLSEGVHLASSNQYIKFLGV